MILRNKNNGGYSLAELVIYIGILVAIVVVIINLLVNIVHARGRITSASSMSSSAFSALDRMTREIRGAKSVNTSLSTLGTSPGYLYLDTTDAVGVARTVEFFLIAGVLHIKVNSVDQGPLTLSNASTTSLIFYRSTATSTEAVRVQMTIASGTSTDYKSENFYTTALLR